MGRIEVKEVEGNCQCGGGLVDVFVRRYDPSTGPPIIGPGSSKQIKKRFAHRQCAVCGALHSHIDLGGEVNNV